MDLREEHLAGRTLQSAPGLDPPLQRAQLAILEPSRILPLQVFEQRLGFQTRVDFQTDMLRAYSALPDALFHLSFHRCAYARRRRVEDEGPIQRFGINWNRFIAG